MSGIDELEVREVVGNEMLAALELSGRALRDNPATLAWASTDPLRRHREVVTFFRATFAESLGLGAFVGDVCVGLAARVPPGACIGVTLADLAAHQHDPVGPPGDPHRAIVFGAATVANDLAEPHWHIGPVSVEPGCQGLGIGSKLLAALCRGLDDEQGIGFLETDKPENVRLYERFGFSVTHIADILGTTVWHMRRERH